MSGELEIFLIRHGQTAYNAEGRYMGSQDIPLNEYAGKVLRRADFSPDIVYVSPLCRARQTAEILFPDACQTVIPDLREMCFGSFEGRNYKEMDHDADYRSWVDGFCMGKCPGGESRGEFTARTCSAFEKLMESHLAAGRRQMVIVAHGGTQMAVLERFGVPRRDYYDWCAKNGEGYLLKTDLLQWKEERSLTFLKNCDFTAKEKL